MTKTTGMRRGELRSLRWQDIDFNDMSLRVLHTAERYSGYGYIENEPKTARSKRKIMLPQFVIEALKRHRVHQLEIRLKAGDAWVDNDLVFCNSSGNFLASTTIFDNFHALLKEAGLPYIRFHDLRHSAATILLSMGVHPKVVQGLLGHSQISMTMDTYSHVLPSMQREAMNKLDDLFRVDEQGDGKQAK